MKSFIRKVIIFIWNVFAVIGILGTCLMIALSVVMIKKHHITPGRLYSKLQQISGLDIKKSQSTDKALIANEFAMNYQLLPLPAHADTTPYKSDKFKDRKIIRVGPGRKYKTPSQVSGIVKNGDIVEIDAFTYNGDVAVWKADNLILRGVNGRVNLNADGHSAQGKGIWVIDGNNVTIENIAFSHARVKDKNGAGIRGQGSGLTVRYCSFYRNEDGILAGKNGDNSTLIVENSEFAYNGHGDGFSHSIYVNKIGKFICQYNYIHHTNIGHHIKSRAATNIIRYNRIMDEAFGNSSMAIDIPDGGTSVIIGNIFHQSKYADNYRIIHYQNIHGEKPEGLYVINNTVASNLKGIFVDNRTDGYALVVNNLIVGPLAIGRGKYIQHHNVMSDLSIFKDVDHYDFHLKPNANAIDAGIKLAPKNGISLYPEKEYKHPLSQSPRIIHGKIDAGAFEFKK